MTRELNDEYLETFYLLDYIQQKTKSVALSMETYIEALYCFNDCKKSYSTYGQVVIGDLESLKAKIDKRLDETIDRISQLTTDSQLNQKLGIKIFDKESDKEKEKD